MHHITATEGAGAICVAPFPPEAYRPDPNEPFDDVCQRLLALCERLQALLPDPSLSPSERLERLARVVPTSTLVSADHKTARKKLKELRRRLDELIPGGDDYDAKLEMLVARLHELVPGDYPMKDKLEAIGDHRRSDNGR
jgi:hypothetical protein